MIDDIQTQASLVRTVKIVAAFLKKNPVSLNNLSSLIASVHGSLSSVGGPVKPPAEVREPAVPIKKSVFPDYIVCLEDGRRLKMLKRHLQTTYSLTPDEYRERWGLPVDYPMVAPNYTKRRSALAKASGLGQVRRQKKAS